MPQKVAPFLTAINELCEEKGLERGVVLETIEAALAAAYRKDYGRPKQIIRSKMNSETGDADIFRVWEVVKTAEEIAEPEQQMTLRDAKKIDKNVKVGGEVISPLPKQTDFGRIAAQTAKQVIIQRLREAERNMLFLEFKDREGEIASATVQQIEGRNVIVALGKASAIMYPSDQIRAERYRPGNRLKVFIKEVNETARGPQILVSRADEGLISGLFKLEVPEINSAVVEIKSIAREPGSRSKIAVFSNDKKIDPVGSCVGQRGTRVQAVLDEIGEEKIDIVLWDDDVERFISNALSPAKTERIAISAKENKAIVYVDEESLSLAIGRGGQNVRLASKLSGWGIDIEPIEEKASKKKTKEKN